MYNIEQLHNSTWSTARAARGRVTSPADKDKYSSRPARSSCSVPLRALYLSNSSRLPLPSPPRTAILPPNIDQSTAVYNSALYHTSTPPPLHRPYPPTPYRPPYRPTPLGPPTRRRGHPPRGPAREHVSAEPAFEPHAARVGDPGRRAPSCCQRFLPLHGRGHCPFVVAGPLLPPCHPPLSSSPLAASRQTSTHRAH